MGPCHVLGCATEPGGTAVFGQSSSSPRGAGTRCLQVSSWSAVVPVPFTEATVFSGFNKIKMKTAKCSPCTALWLFLWDTGFSISGLRCSVPSDIKREGAEPPGPGGVWHLEVAEATLRAAA